MIMAIISQSRKATSWQYLGVAGTANMSVNRGNLARCDTNQTNSLNYLNSNYPASNYDVGYTIKVGSVSGFFPNQVVCSDRVFKAV